MAARKVLVLNGPNLNMLGKREPAIYGPNSLDDLRIACEADGTRLGLEIDFRQTNLEGTLIDWCQEAREAHDGIVINAAALTHTSVALMDALLASETPVVEVHLSNIHARESFRHHSYISPIAVGVIVGFGPLGYRLALEAMAEVLS